MALLHINTPHLIVNLLPQKQSGETQFVIITMYLYLYHKIHKIILSRSLKISKHLAIQLKLAHIN